MMLSASAARMGTVKTTLRQIGKSGRLRTPSAVSSRSGKAFWSSWSLKDGIGKSFSIMTSTTPSTKTSRLSDARAALMSDSISRRKSTMASYAESDDEEENTIYVVENTAGSDKRLSSHHGHAEAAKSRVDGMTSLDDSWRINLGRGDNNAWLTGPRNEDEWFTGLKPSVCPGVDSKGKIRSLPLPRLDAVTRGAAKDYFNNSWTLYETLFAGLNGEEYFYRYVAQQGAFCLPQRSHCFFAIFAKPHGRISCCSRTYSPPPHELRHPQIFYYGHTACLYVNKLRVSGVLDKPVNAYFESIFEVGVDEMLWDDMHKNDMLWPTVREVHEYRQQVHEVVVDAIMNHPSLDDSNGPVHVDQSHPMWALFMGYEHERIHFETSSVLFREAPFHLVQTPENWPPLHPSAYETANSPASNPLKGVDYPENTMIAVNRDTVDLGKPADFPSFGWDNEYGERNLEVPPFSASEHMVTNGEFYQFVKEGGNRTKHYWSDDGWAWRTHRNLKWPYFWEQVGPAGSHEYSLRTIFDIVTMPWDWPVDVTYYEAKAFCNWKVSVTPFPVSGLLALRITHFLVTVDSARTQTPLFPPSVTDRKGRISHI
jgi:Sulfatase-modifying factor enzyme 1